MKTATLPAWKTNPLPVTTKVMITTPAKPATEAISSPEPRALSLEMLAAVERSIGQPLKLIRRKVGR